VQRSNPAFIERLPDTTTERGAKIPPFLINRQIGQD
jgi:hypothetical protein